jgi:hypothetical protein
MAGLPQTNVVLGPGGQAHGLENATLTMAQATGKSMASATKTYAKLQPVNITTTVKLVAEILG